MDITNLMLYSAPLAGIIGLIFAVYLVLYIMKLDAGSEQNERNRISHTGRRHGLPEQAV